MEILFRVSLELKANLFYYKSGFVIFYSLVNSINLYPFSYLLLISILVVLIGK